MAAPPSHIPGAQGRLGFSACPGSCGSCCSQTVTPSLLLGMWPSLAFPAHEKARASLQLPPRPGTDPGSCIPPSTHGTFSLSPCPLLTAYPGRTLGSSATGWYRCLLPACCQCCLSSLLASGFPVHLPQQSHTSQAPSRPRYLASHGTHQSRCPQPFQSLAHVSLYFVQGLTLCTPTAPSFLQSPPHPGFDTFPSWVKTQEVACSSSHGSKAFVVWTCGLISHPQQELEVPSR